MNEVILCDSLCSQIEVGDILGNLSDGKKNRETTRNASRCVNCSGTQIEFLQHKDEEEDDRILVDKTCL